MNFESCTLCRFYNYKQFYVREHTEFFFTFTQVFKFKFFWTWEIIHCTYSFFNLKACDILKIYAWNKNKRKSLVSETIWIYILSTQKLWRFSLYILINGFISEAPNFKSQHQPWGSLLLLLVLAQ